MNDIYNLQRFVEAQAKTFETIIQELASGQKRTHWMWYVFPQIQGLGHSTIAKRFAISSLEESIAYLKHPILGPRLRQCTQLVINLAGLSIEQIFSYPDYLKFHSSMTLFTIASTDNYLFMEALNKYFGGKQDKLTLDILKTLEPGNASTS